MNKWKSTALALTEAEKHWLAAAIDFEGCLSIGECKAHRSKNGNPAFRTRISVGVTDKPLIDRIRGLTNDSGYVFHRKRMSGHYKDVWEWVICDRQVDEFLPIIYPYLIAKQPQADILFSFRASYRTYPNHPLPNSVIRKRRGLIKELKNVRRLNNE